MRQLKLTCQLSDGRSDHHSLAEGVYVIGRNADCDIVLDHPTISGQHARLSISAQGILLEDMGSSNGILLDGVRIAQQSFDLPARLYFGDAAISIEDEGSISQLSSPFSMIPRTEQSEFPQFDAMKGSFSQRQPQSLSDLASHSLRLVRERTSSAMQWVNKHVEWKYATAAIVLSFATLNTLITLLPLMERSREYLKDEATKRATFIAKQLAHSNERAVVFRNHLMLSTKLADRQDGVISAMIVDTDGRIMAPAHKANRQISSVKEIANLKADETKVEHVGESEILVTQPIIAFSPSHGKNIVKALAQIRFSTQDLGLTSDGMSRIVVISIVSSLALGLFFYFFLYLLTSQSFAAVEGSISRSMKGGLQAISPNIRFSELSPVISRVNNLIVKAREKGSGELGEGTGDVRAPIFLEHRYLSPFVNMAEHATFVIDRGHQVVSANQAAAQYANTSLEGLLEHSVFDFITDHDLHTTVAELINQARAGQDTAPVSETITTREGTSLSVAVSVFSESTDGHGAQYSVLHLKELDY